VLRELSDQEWQAPTRAKGDIVLLGDPTPRSARTSDNRPLVAMARCSVCDGYQRMSIPPRNTTRTTCGGKPHAPAIQRAGTASVFRAPSPSTSAEITGWC
jgi:hypothetical protein